MINPSRRFKRHAIAGAALISSIGAYALVGKSEGTMLLCATFVICAIFVAPKLGA